VVEIERSLVLATSQILEALVDRAAHRRRDGLEPRLFFADARRALAEARGEPAEAEQHRRQRDADREQPRRALHDVPASASKRYPRPRTVAIHVPPPGIVSSFLRSCCTCTSTVRVRIVPSR